MTPKCPADPRFFSKCFRNPKGFRHFRGSHKKVFAATADPANLKKLLVFLPCRRLRTHKKVFAAAADPAIKPPALPTLD